ncbi:MAG: 4-vinyl reductase [Thermoplasmata archaeon]
MAEIKDLYEGVLSHAAYGMFFREGKIIGFSLWSTLFNDDGRPDSEEVPDEEFVAKVSDILVKRHIVKSISIDMRSMRIVVSGSVEVTNSKDPTCHRLRGILSALFEKKLNKKILCHEIECRSTGAKECVFVISNDVSLF